MALGQGYAPEPWRTAFERAGLRLGAKGPGAALTHPLPEGSLEEEGQRGACVVTQTWTLPMSPHHPLQDASPGPGHLHSHLSHPREPPCP